MLSLAVGVAPNMLGGMWTPYAFFADGSQGAWYDPSDFSTLYQDSAGTTPVTAVGQAVGLLLDKRLGVQARRNRLTYSSQFSNAAWVRTNILSVTAKADGVGDLVVPSAVSGVHAVAQASTSAGTQNVATVRAKPGGYSQIAVQIGAANLAYFDLQNGVVLSTSGVGTIASISAASGFPGYYDCTIYVPSPTSAAAYLYEAVAGSTTFTGDGASGIYLARAQLEWNTTTPSAYQDVTSGAGGWTPGNHSSQSTTPSCPTERQPTPGYALRSDGVDDNLAATTGGGGTAGILICAAITVNGGAGAARTIWSDAGTNTGYIIQLSSSNTLALAAGNGTAYTSANAGTWNVGETHVLTMYDEGVNLSAQIDNNAAVTVARPAVSAGTAGFTLFKQNGSSAQFAPVDCHQFVYVQGTAKTAADRARLKTYVGAKAGIAL